VTTEQVSDSRGFRHLLVANLETRRAVSLRPSLPIVREPPLWHERGCGVDADGAARRRLPIASLCWPSKRPGAVAVVTEQPRRHRRPRCSYRREAVRPTSDDHAGRDLLLSSHEYLADGRRGPALRGMRASAHNRSADERLMSEQRVLLDP